MIECPLALTFDDVLLVPKPSRIKSRSEPSTETVLGSDHFDIPIVAAPMNTVCEIEMIKFMADMGGASAIHRFMNSWNQVNSFDDAKDPKAYVSVGITGDYLTRVKKLRDFGCHNFLVDVANGHNESTRKAVEAIREELQNGENIMAGNVVTEAGAIALWGAGANIIRVGIGPGSACTTRVVTGHGMPQLSAISNVAEGKYDVDKIRYHIVADGGIRTSGDAVKALAAGADAIMIGGLLAGTDQAPGEFVLDPYTHQAYKLFAGMASETGRKPWFGQKGATSHIPEGESFRVPYKGDATPIIERLIKGIKIGMSYSGAHSISELQIKAKWIRVTANGHREGNANKRMHSL